MPRCPAVLLLPAPLPAIVPPAPGLSRPFPLPGGSQARYCLYDRDTRKARFLFTNRKDLEGLPLAPMHPVTIRSGDGLDLACYYTLPPASDLTGKGKPGARPVVDRGYSGALASGLAGSAGGQRPA
jgi:hypothetical protein